MNSPRPDPARRRLLRGALRTGALSLATVPWLAACGDPDVQWSLYNVRGHLPDLQFSLIGPDEKPFTEENVRGKTVLMFFGFASCPDVCPTTMAQLTEVLRLLGPSANEVRILFVSVDPFRDTPALLQAYVSAFNTSAIGLTGETRAIAALARRYRVAYQIEKPKNVDEPGQYDVTHSRGVYVFDNQGRARLLASDTTAPDVMARDIGQLITLTRT